jgi:predicted neuraminidase
MSNRSVAILIIVACILHGWAIWRWNASPVGAPPLFHIIPPQDNMEDPRPFFTEEFIIPPVESGMVHVASVCEKADGKLAAVWYAGSREAAPDVAIYFSERDAQKAQAWSKPRVVADPASASKELGRLVGKVGNPVLFSDSNGRLWLIYVTMPFGGWSGSSLNVKTSDDGGLTWSESKRLTLSPFFNISELVRNNPVPLHDGGFALPIYHECMRAFPEMLRIYADSSNTRLRWKKTRMAAARNLIQPSIVAWDERSATVFFRSTSGRAAVAAATTEDGGETWSEPFFLDLPNPNASLNALTLSRERVLLAFNDSTEGRENLRLALSSDRGAHWTRIATLEDTRGGEFSYPYMIRDRSGRIHIVYTWRRQSIKHVTFNDAWIEERFQSSN